LRAELLEDRLVPGGLPALSPQQLLDINPSASSKPGPSTQVNNLLFFHADDGTHGFELWESNGSAAGTFLVKDINPGASYSYPDYLTNVNGTLFFQASDGTRGQELWESNGTAAGTFLVKDINSGAGDSFPYLLTNVNGTLFFSANDGTQGQELWESNGTAAGTFLIKDINPSSASSYPHNLTNVNGTLFFQAVDGTHGSELWESNGSAAGTFLVKDINPGASGAYPAFLTNVNGTLFFQANDVTNGVELWVTNGSAAGTFLVKDINPGAGDSAADQLTNMNGTVFFRAYDGTHGYELWESNGTAAGTFLVKDINPGSNGPTLFSPTNVNGDLFFEANDGIHGFELWASNGTADGTFLVQDINPGVHGSYPQNLTNVNGTLFFQANDGTHGFEEWIVQKPHSSTAFASVSAASVYGERVAFVALVTPVPSGAAMPTGSVTFKEGSTVLAANVSLSNGHAAFNTASLSVGSHTITAFYSGDGFFQAGSVSTIQTVSKAATSTALSSSPNPSVSGQGIIFTATVSAVAPSSRTPTGTVDFKEGATDLTPGGITLSGGRAIFVTSALAVGSHTITAIYSGNANFSGSQAVDSATPHAVNKAASHLVIFSLPDPSMFGQVVSFTASVVAVSPGGGAPTGSVIFEDGTTTIGSVTLSGGRATFTTASLSRAGHAISAFYSGDANFTANSYMNYGQNVIRAGTTTTLTPSANPVVVGQPLTLTASIQAVAPGAGTPTGTVTFKDFTTVLGTGTVDAAGKATFTTSALALGTHGITATYQGDSNFTVSVSAVIAEVVKSSAQIAAISPTPSGNATRALASIQPNTTRALTPQSIDDFFSPAGHKRPLAQASVVPRRVTPGKDWADLDG
jgi:ELWxxDGT repeat protein